MTDSLTDFFEHELLTYIHKLMRSNICAEYVEGRASLLVNDEQSVT